MMSDKQHSNFHKAIGVTLGLIVCGASLWLLKKQLGGKSLQDILVEFKHIPARQFWAASGFVVLNYFLMGLYEQLVLRYVKHPLPLGRLAAGTFVSYSITNNLGWALGGPLGRYRLYTQWGMTSAEVVKIVAMLGLTYWIGLHAFSGSMMLIEHLPIPASVLELLHLSDDKSRWLGIVFVLLAVVYLGLCCSNYRKVAIWGWELELPPAKLVFPLMFVAGLNMVAMAAVLFTLLPAEAQISFPYFLNVFLFAMVAVYLAHVPGGIGVLEFVMISLLPECDIAHLTASLLAFRVVLFLVPLIGALLFLVGYEVAKRVELNKD